MSANCSPSSPKPPILSTVMAGLRHKQPTIIHNNNCYNYISGSSSTLILDLKSFIVKQLTQLNCFRLWETKSPRPLPELRSFTPLQDFRPQTLRCFICVIFVYYDHCVVVYPFLGLFLELFSSSSSSSYSFIMTTRCLAVTGGDSIVTAAD